MTAPDNVKTIDFAPLPNGFQRKDDGIYRVLEDEDGNRRLAWLCSPLRVLALPRDRSGTGWGRLVEVTDPDGRQHRWAIPARMFAGDGTDVRARLLDLGMDLAPGPTGRNSLLDLLQRWRPKARAVTTDRMGWADEACTAFTFGNDNVTAACVGNPLMLVAVSLAFAGPLLEPLGIDGGGLHLRGASSRGKSTIQRVAVSVWGSPRFLHTWRATANGLEGIAVACNASLLALDELGEVSGREAGQCAYMLANGCGKARADRAGMARASLRWRVMVLSSGEIALADKVAEAGGRVAAGQGVRLLDIAADDQAHGAFDDLHDATDGAAFADRLRAATATQYGTAGPAFVEKFIANREAAARELRESITGCMRFLPFGAGRSRALAGRPGRQRPGRAP